LGLINDILDTAKLEQGAVELEVLPFSLRDICQQTIDSLRLTTERKA
jgi:signal transduction histidine kinase